MERSFQFQALLDDGHERVHGHDNSDLRLHGVDGCAIALLDSQMLLDPFEEQLDLPPRLVQLADGQRRRIEQVGRKH